MPGRQLDLAQSKWPTWLAGWPHDAIAVSVRGRLLMRTVAMVFDRFLRGQREKARYSRVI